MKITSAQYNKSIISDTASITATIDGEVIIVPNNAPDNRHYAAILEWAKEDGNTIQDAD
tara:strand:- start:208 stop:384 length:177 start_codon:yes stop_codon:yes gene_type:complete